MNDLSVPLLVLTTEQDDVELINRVLRDAGRAVRCDWVQLADALAAALDACDAELIVLFPDRFAASIADVAKIRQRLAPTVPLIAVREAADEQAMAEALLAGAQDLVSAAQKQRFCAVAERELRAFRLERALGETLASASEYRKQLKSFVAGSADAIAHVQEGIIVEANQAWADVLGLGAPGDALGPLMDSFDTGSQPILKGALNACAKGHWGGELLKLRAITSEGAAVPLRVAVETIVIEGEPALKLSVPRTDDDDPPEELVHDALHADPATGLHHRQRFIELLTDRLDAPLRGGVRALAYVRLDKFGEIEDEVGPVASEEIIVQLAGLLREMAHDNDLLSRFGGTLFTMLLERGTLRDIEAWAEHALSRIAAHVFEIGDKSMSLACTIGLAEVAPGTDRVEGLIRDAERANQRGRKRGGNQVVLEETSDESTRVRRFDSLWVHQIKSALVDNRFKLQPLPIASLNGKSARFIDTVVRLIDQQGDEVPATDFIPAAGRHSLLRPIDRWVIGAAFQYCATEECDLLFVKISHDSVRDATLVPWLKQLIEQHAAVAPARLCLQVSEEVATQYLKHTNTLAEQLKALGFHFAIEHFGIGRDPMRVLSQVAMNYVKIDGSLMQSIAADHALQERVRGFITAATKRKILTIAERVEDANTMAILFQLGVGFVQGHYLHEAEVVLEGR